MPGTIVGKYGYTMRSSRSRLIELPRIDDPRGSLSYLETGVNVPFGIRRVFYIYDVPAGARRAGHALLTCEQLIVPVSGAFDAVVDAGEGKSSMRLRSADQGLYVPPLNWLELEHFAPGTVCLVFASEPYNASSYIRGYDEFRAAVAA